jgi:hypothetical protein
MTDTVPTFYGSDNGADQVTKLNQLALTLKRNFGTTTIDFGAFPGSSDASVAITGQTGIVAGSIVRASLRLFATSDHTADEHRVETIKVYAGNIVAGTGFTIYATNTSEKNQPDGQGTRISGQWSVQWDWV